MEIKVGYGDNKKTIVFFQITNIGKMKTLRKEYEMPLTERVEVEMESGICSASANVDGDVNINSQDYEDIDFTDSADGWDDNIL